MDCTGNTGSDTAPKAPAPTPAAPAVTARPIVPARFFGLSGSQLGGAGLAIIGLVALVFFFARKKKK